MFEQQLYTRSNTGGVFTKTPGFSTVSASHGFTKELEKTISAKYLAITEINKLSNLPKIRYRFFDGTNVIIGQAMQRNEPENRNPILVHNYVSHDPGDIKNLDVEILSAELDFIDSFSESDGGRILEEVNLIEKNRYYPIQSIDSSLLSLLALTLISNLDQAKKQQVFIVLDVTNEILTQTAVRFMKELYSYIPYNMRYKIGFNSLFMGNISYELYNNGIQIYFVPREKGIIQNRLGSLSLSNEVVLDFVNNKNSNLIEEMGAFGHLLKEKSVEEVNTFFIGFDEFIKNSEIEQGSLLEILDAYVLLSSNSFDDISHIIEIMNKVHTQVSIEKLTAYLQTFIKQNHGEFDEQLISQMLMISELDELSLEMLEKTLTVNMKNRRKVIDTINLTNSFEKLNKELVNGYLANNVDIMTMYIISLVKTVSNPCEFLREISKIYEKYLEFMTSSEFRLILDRLYGHFGKIFTFKGLNQELWETYNKLREKLPNIDFYTDICRLSFQKFEVEYSQLTESDYQHFVCRSKQQEIIETVAYQSANSIKKILEGIKTGPQNKEVTRIVIDTLDRFVKTASNYEENCYRLSLVSSSLKNNDDFYTAFFEFLLTNRKDDFVRGLKFALDGEVSKDKPLEAAVMLLEKSYKSLGEEEQKSLSSETIKVIKSLKVDEMLKSSAIKRIKILQEQFNPSVLNKIGKLFSKANRLSDSENEGSVVDESDRSSKDGGHQYGRKNMH